MPGAYRPLVVLGSMLAGPGPLAGQPSAGQPPALTVSGVIYTQYAYALRRAAGAGHENNFDVTRAYLNFIGRFGEGVGSRLTGDIYRTGDGSLAYRLKYGYVSYRPGRGALTFKFGQFETPFVAYNENLWDYRMQGPDPTDRAGYLSSSDFGVGVEGTWNDDGVILSSGVFNGEFYSRRPGDQHKDVAARLSVRLVRSDERGSYGGLRLTGFALLGEPNGGGRRHRLLGQVSYRSRALLLAGTAMATRDRVDPEPTARGSLLSLMGVYRIPGIRAAIIGRFDTHDPNAEAPADALNRLIAGASYQVSPNLRVLVDLDQTWYEGRVSPAVDAARSQALFQLQLVF